MADIGASLMTSFDYVWGRFTDRTSGLTDEEYFWEPVEGCWNLRLGDDGRWHLDGDGGGGPAPEPVPITTIAWRIGHVAGMAVGGFADRLFGDGTMTPSTIDYPPSAEDVPRFLAQHYQTWRAGLAGIDQHAYLHPVGPAWGRYAESSTLDVTLHVFDEVVHHAAEVALLRDLYLHRGHFIR